LLKLYVSISVSVSSILISSLVSIPLVPWLIIHYVLKLDVVLALLISNSMSLLDLPYAYIICILNTRTMLSFEFLSTFVANFSPTSTSDKIASRFLLNPELAFWTLLTILLFDVFKRLFITLIKITADLIFLTSHVIMPGNFTFDTVVHLANRTIKFNLIVKSENVRAVCSWAP